MLDNNLKELECNLNTEDNIHSYNIKKVTLTLLKIISLKVLEFDLNAIGVNTVKNYKVIF